MLLVLYPIEIILKKKPVILICCLNCQYVAVVALKYTHKFFETFLIKRWVWFPSLWIWVTLVNGMNIMLNDFWSKVSQKLYSSHLVSLSRYTLLEASCYIVRKTEWHGQAMQRNFGWLSHWCPSRESQLPDLWTREPWDCSRSHPLSTPTQSTIGRAKTFAPRAVT
jgi:hypothetical protein